MTRTLIALPLLFLLIALPLAGCQNQKHQSMYVQGMIGANTVGKDHVSYTKLPADATSEPSTDLPTAPMIAFAGQQPLVGDFAINAGVEFGGTLTWWRDGADVYGYTGGGGTVVIVNYDNRMWMVDFFGGPYASLMLGEKVRIYGGVGPTIVWAGLEYDAEYEGVNGRLTSYTGYDDEWSWGGYGRVGLEYMMSKRDLVGIGVRYLRTDFRFSELDTSLDFETWQIMATFTTKF